MGYSLFSVVPICHRGGALLINPRGSSSGESSATSLGGLGDCSFALGLITIYNPCTDPYYDNNTYDEIGRVQGGVAVDSNTTYESHVFKVGGTFDIKSLLLMAR